MTATIVKLSERPDLAAITARWRWEAFFREDGIGFADILREEMVAAVCADLYPTVLVLLESNRPVGMVALCLDDLEDRPDLNPWLAGLYVEPADRGKGHALRLMDALETLAPNEGIDRLSLYTASAAELYARAGWTVVEMIEKNAKPFSIMRKTLRNVSAGSG